MSYDDDDEYGECDDTRSPPTAKRSKWRMLAAEFRGGDSPRYERPAAGDMFKHEFGLHGWSAGRVVAMLLVVVVLAVVFVARFGTDPTTITNRIKRELGESSGPTAALVVAPRSVTNLTVNVQSTPGGGVHAAALIGVREDRCIQRVERRRLAQVKGESVQLSFGAKLGHHDSHGRLLVFMDDNGEDISQAMLSAGLVRLNAGQANASGKGAALNAAQASARAQHRGMWGAPCHGR